MIRKFLTGAVVCALAGLTLIGTLHVSDSRVSAKPRKSPEKREFRDNGLIIKPKRGASDQSIRALHASLGVGVSARFADLGNIEVLDLPPGLSVVAAMERYMRHPLIEYAEPDFIVNTSQISPQFTPNDLVSNLWGLNNTGQTGGTVDADIDAPEAWDIRTDASTVIVGVVDTGIDYNHPDLAANMWRNVNETAGDGIDNDGNGYIDDVHGINGITNSGNPMDDQYHGTHVSGTIGAVGNNGVGLVGVAPNVKLMGLKFLSSSGSGSTSDAIKCINYGRQMGAHILSNSWGGGGFSQALYDAISAANNAGVLFVAAAGNSSADNDGGEYYPANYNVPNVVAVAATDHNDARSSFSSYGYKKVLLGAPGTNIYSTYPNNSYNTISGTSMATPHVSGAFAMLKAHRPDLDTLPKLIQHIAMSTDPIPSMANITYSGGRLNLHKALSGQLRAIAHISSDKRSAAPGDVITFTDNSLGPNITSRTIDFGDGSIEPISGSAQHVYSASGNYTVTLKIVSGGIEYTRSMTVAVQENYTVSSGTYDWVDTTGMTAVTLTDDSASGIVTLPFTLRFYGGNYTSLYIGSNGLVTLGGSTGATAFSNSAIPSSATPNAALYPYWDDLNPATGGTIRHGSFPGGYVVSYEGVPHYSDSTAKLFFQVHIYQTGEIEFHYQDVKPTLANGGGKSATVGIEDATGSTARQYSLNGSSLLSNNSAVRFSIGAPAGPNAPTALSATAVSSSRIDLSWNDNSADETGFQIEQSSNGGSSFTALATVATGVRTYSHSGLSAGTTRHYRVRAVNASGNSNYSNTASATTLAPPAAPSGLTASAASSSQINVSWTDNSGDETGFSLESSTNGTNYSVLASLGANVTSYQHTGLSAGSLVYYRVRAVNSSGNSAYSSVASATTPSVPAAPSGLTATAVSGSQINVAWTDNSGNESAFDLEVSTDGTNFTPLASTATNVVSYAHTGLAAGTQRFYRVKARNSSGSSEYSSTASAQTLSVPSAPSTLTASATGPSSIAVTWANVADETGYILEVSNSVSGFAPIETQLLADVTSFNHTGLSEGIQYTYRIKAVNSFGESAYSGTASATTPWSVPNAVTNLVATATSSSQVALTWSDVSNNETGFRVERALGTNTTFTVVANLGANSTSYNDSGLAGSTTYRYRVIAVNNTAASVGNSEYSVTTLAAPQLPATPTNLRVTSTSRSTVSLAWNYNSTVPATFVVQRQSGKSWVTVSTAPLSSLTFTDTGLLSRTRYTYRVYAVNSVGQSGYSASVSGTTTR